MTEKQYTISEVIELQNQKKQLEQRLEVHRQRAQEKKQELQEIFTRVGVKNLTELSQKCATLNAEMQTYAVKEQQDIDKMREYCDNLDRML